MIIMSTRKKYCLSVILVSLFASLALYSCQKDYPITTHEPLDYALQVIPDIHDVTPTDLMEAVGITNLHFGDNPPKLYIDSLGFVRKYAKVWNFIKADSTTQYGMTIGETKLYTNCFHFYDQHRGIAKYDYKCVNLDTIYGGVSHQYYIEYSNVTDSVFIMGEKPYFTAYFTQKRHKESSFPNMTDYGSHEYIILTGEVTSTGIKDFYYGLKVKAYDNPADAGYSCLNINDIVVYYIDFLPFRYWDPSQHYNN